MWRSCTRAAIAVAVTTTNVPRVESAEIASQLIDSSPRTELKLRRYARGQPDLTIRLHLSQLLDGPGAGSFSVGGGLSGSPALRKTLLPSSTSNRIASPTLNVPRSSSSDSGS